MNTKLFFILLASPMAAFAQEKVETISKAQVLERVLSENNSLKIAQQTIEMAQGSFNQTNAVFMPNITASHTGIRTTNPLMAFGSKLNQEILTQNDFNPNLLNNPARTDNYSTKIEVVQPLLNIDGMYQRKAAKSALNATKLQSQRTKEYLILEVENAYMQLQLAYKTADVLRTAKKAVLENKRIAQDNFTQGYLQKPDLLAIDVRATEVENQLQYALSAIKNASNYISILTNDTSFTLLQPADSLSLVTTEMAISALPESRADIQALDYATKAFEATHKANNMSFLPRLNAFGSYELYDDEVFQTGANGYLVGAQLSWSVLEGTKRIGKSKTSKAALEKSKIEYQDYIAQSQLELNKATRMLQDAKNNVSLTELALQQSKESLRIRLNRFKEGLEKTSDVLIAETQYAQKQLEYYQTLYALNYAKAYVTFLSKA